MKILGLDKGASSTKIVILENQRLIYKKIINQAYFLPQHDKKFVAQEINEFDCNSRGALFLTKLNSAIVVSCGTGASVILARKNQPAVHLGGTGVGGGTLLGLSQLILKTSSPETIFSLAQQGDKTQVNLTVKDILGSGIGLLPPDATAANFGKIKSSKKTDFAAGLLCLVAETIAMTACLASGKTQEKNLVFIGHLSTNPLIQAQLSQVCALFKLTPHFPENAAFATALGATLSPSSSS